MADIKVQNVFTGAEAYVPQDQIDLAQQEGWEVIGGTPANQLRVIEAGKYQGIGQQATAAAEAAIGELTLGMIRPEYYSDEAAKRREHALAGRWVGGTIGAVAPILLSGGAAAAAKGVQGGSKLLQAGRAISTLTPAGALARGGAALERTVAGKLATSSPALRNALSMGAAGALEGGVGSAVEGASYEYSQSQDLAKAAQAFAASGGIGALLGGGAGGAFGAGVGRLQRVPTNSSNTITKAIDELDPGAGQRILQKNSQAIKELSQEMAANPRMSEPIFKALKVFEDITNEATTKTKKLTDTEIGNLKLERSKLQNALEAATDENQVLKIQQQLDNVTSAIEGGVKHTDLTTDSVLKAYTRIAEDMQTPAFKSAVSPDLHAKLTNSVQSTLDEISELSAKATKELDNSRILGSAWLKKQKDEQFLKMLGSNQSGLTALRKANPTMGDDEIVSFLERELGELTTEAGQPLLSPRGMMPASVDEILPGIQYQKAVIGNQIDDVINGADKWVRANAPEYKPRTDVFLSKLDETIADAAAMPTKSQPWIKDFEKLRDSEFGWKEIWEFRNRMDAKYARGGKVPSWDPAYLELRNELDNSLLNQLDDVAKKGMDLEVDTGQLIRKQKALGQVETLAEYGVARDTGNQFFSLSDKMQGIGGGIMSSLSHGKMPDLVSIAGGIAGVNVLASGDFDNIATIGGLSVLGAAGSRAYRRRGASLIYNMLKSQRSVARKISTKTQKATTSRQMTTAAVPAAMEWLKYNKTEKPEDGLKKHKDKLLGGIINSDAILESPKSSPEQRALAELQRRKSEYLLSVYPKTEKADKLQPKIVRKIIPSPIELARYGRVHSLLNDPMSVYDRIEAGNLSEQEADGLATVYPDLYTDMKEEMYKVLDSDVEINQQRRKSIETFLGISGHSNQMPVAQSTLQQSTESPSRPKVSTTKGLIQSVDKPFSLS